MLRSAVIDSLRARWHPDISLCRTTPNPRFLVHELAILSLPNELFVEGFLGILLMIQTFRGPKVSETKHLLEIILIDLSGLNNFWLSLVQYGFFRLLSVILALVLAVPRPTSRVSSLVLPFS